MNERRFYLAAMLVMAFASSCVGCLGCESPVGKDNSNLPGSCQSAPPVVAAAKLDILFVIDNSNSMAEEQEGVARELTAFIDEVKKGGGIEQDFHIGVITTSVYLHSLVNGVNYFGTYPNQAGHLQPVPDGAADGGVLLGTGIERVLNGDDPELISKFARLVHQGVKGSGQETPFEATRLALFDLMATPLDQGGNGGFLRDGARLLVVVLSDEDDCSEKARPSIVHVGDNPSVDDCHDQGNSLTPVSEYHRLFTEELGDGLGGHREVIWTAIAPVARSNKAAMLVLDGAQIRNIDCPTSNEPGIRHRQMAEAFDPTLVNLDSICRESYRDTLLNIASLVNISQWVDLTNVPDPHMLQLSLTRQDGSVQRCTLQQGLSKWDEPKDGKPGRIYFGPDCKRRTDDQKIEVKMLCAN